MRAFKWSFLFLFFFTMSPSTSYAVTQTNAAEVHVAQNFSVIQLVHKSREALSTKDMTTALQYARAAVSSDPAYAEAWKQLGRILMLKGDYDEALSSFKIAIELKPDDKDIPGWILRSLMAKGDIDELVKRLLTKKESGITLFDTQTITALLSALIEKSDMQNAVKVITLWEAKALSSGDRQAATGLRQILQGNPADAKRTLVSVSATSVETYPLLALAWTRLGVQYLERNEIADSVNAFHQALKFQHNWIPALRELGWAYRRSGKPSMAADTWDLGLKKNPGLVKWLQWIVEARIEAGELELASKTLGHMLRAEPKSEHGQSLKLMLLLIRKDENAVRLYEKELQSQKRGSYVISMGHILADRYNGRYSEAAGRLEELLRSQPQDNEIQDLLVDTYAAWAAHSEAKDALSPLQKLVALKPKQSGAWRDYGWSLWVNGQHDQAIGAWENALNNGSENRERLVKQVVARLSEDDYTARAIEFYKRWEPGKSLTSIGRSLFQDSRYIAASQILSQAWEQGEDRPTIGPYLAYSEARIGFCKSVPDHINAYLDSDQGVAKKPEMKFVLEALDRCSDEKSVVPVIIKCEPLIDPSSEYFSSMNNIMEKAGDLSRNKHDFEDSYYLYQRVLKRDPNRNTAWLKFYEIAEMLSRQKEAKDLLADVSRRTASAAVRYGIEGQFAADKGDIASAVDHYRKSLAADVDQPGLRYDLFKLLLLDGRFQEARGETKWFEERLAAGDETVRSYLAAMISDLGDTARALELWQRLYMTYPEYPVYAVETARALYLQCRAEEAVPILEESIAINPQPRTYELLTEIELALGHRERALELTGKALALQPTPGILRLRAEIAQSLEKLQIAGEAAESMLRGDRGNVPMAGIVGEEKSTQVPVDEAKHFFQDLLERNSSFLPACIRLREISTRQKKQGEALGYARTALDQRPWDLNTALSYAVSLAEANRFRSSLKILREEVSSEPKQAVPLLIFSGVTQCRYSNQITSQQVARHLERLSSEGYTFITPDELDRPKDKPRVMVLITNPSPEALRNLDATLKRIGGRAILATSTGARLGQVPNNPGPSELRELQASGRWVIASAGPENYNRAIIDDAGTLGNPLTHRLYTFEGKEDIKTMSERLNKMLDAASSSLPPRQTHVFFYPGGDYGQLSLDTEQDALKALKSAVQNHFNFAIATDDYGFVTHGFDPLRLPGRVVPANWSSDDLMNHIRIDNPFVLARLDLAKVLYWGGQYERADQWFRKARSLGAAPSEVNFHWGNSAYQEGALPSALEKLRLSVQLDPASERYRTALDRAENGKSPLLDLDYHGWRDNDKRSYLQYGGSVYGYVSDRLQIGIMADHDQWARTGLGSEQGNRIGAGALWHFADEYWVTGRVWHMLLDHISDHWGGLVNVHIPNTPLGGNIEFEAAHEEIDTVEAVRVKILANRFAINTYSRIGDVWDLFLYPSYTHRTDSNDTYRLDGSFGRRLHEWPFLGVGYAFSLANSDRNPPEYWAPRGLLLHQLYLETRGQYKKLHFSGSIKAGYARETHTDWHFVWGGRLNLNYFIMSRFALYGTFIHQETPIYKSDEWLAGIKYIF